MTKSPMSQTVSAPVHGGVRGFTLIEMMVVVAIIAILAVIAIPSYRQYAIRNAESQAQAKMLQLQIELEQWRARALSYQGFQPKVINSATNDITYAYADSPTTNKTIYVPDGSTAADYRYQITLVDGTVTTKSLVSGADVDNVTGRTWKMLAIPNSTGITKNAHYFVLTSSGLRCQNSSEIDISIADCGMGQEIW